MFIFLMKGVFGMPLDAVTSFTITPEVVAPVTDAISSGLTVLVPIGIGIMATFVGIRLIPRIIYMFL